MSIYEQLLISGKEHKEDLILICKTQEECNLAYEYFNIPKSNTLSLSSEKQNTVIGWYKDKIEFKKVNTTLKGLVDFIKRHNKIVFNIQEINYIEEVIDVYDLFEMDK